MTFWQFVDNHFFGCALTLIILAVLLNSALEAWAKAWDARKVGSWPQSSSEDD